LPLYKSTEGREPLIRWSTVDSLGGTAIQFTTSVGVTGEVSKDLPASAQRRLMCLYIVSNLDSDSLDVACEKLVDIYRYQAEQSVLTYSEPAVFSVGRAALRHVEPTPFTYEDE
jgi:hypothetical protein